MTTEAMSRALLNVAMRAAVHLAVVAERVAAALKVLDGWEHDGPDDPAIHLLVQRVREALGGAS